MDKDRVSFGRESVESCASVSVPAWFLFMFNSFHGVRLLVFVDYSFVCVSPGGAYDHYEATSSPFFQNVDRC
jgi:hypothetical protein